MMSDSSSFLTGQSSSGSSSRIEVGDPSDVEDDEFAPSDVDLESVDTFGSVTSSILRHAYENGRRVGPRHPRRS